MAGESSNGSKKKLVIIMVLAVVLLAGGGVGAWLMLGDKPKQEEAAAAKAAEQSAAIQSAYYVLIPQPFVFNVTGDKRDRLVQVQVQLLVRGERDEATANEHVPLIESTLLQTFAAATVEQLRTPTGRSDLRQQALSAVQNALMKVSGRQVAERVLFTGFVMQ
ncbi:flagellar basal body-associated protein FliL [Photobacterium nomapromontoriensis]|uniref:flagellar basal body-associated protein FliL n=1 Tax=Photobacterium nomapromontoriensis TaxID=2910237 RepID=UPI003D0D87C8